MPFPMPRIAKCKGSELSNPRTLPTSSPVFGLVNYQQFENYELLETDTESPNPVWETRNWWTEATVAAYREAAHRAGSLANSDKNLDKASSEDFAFAFLLEFAFNNGLPVHITNANCPQGLNNEDHDRILGFCSFKKELLASTDAADLELPVNTLYRFGDGAQANDLDRQRKTQPGDLFRSNAMGTRASHTQLVTGVIEKTAHIYDGPYSEVVNIDEKAGDALTRQKANVCLWNFAHWNYMAFQIRRLRKKCRQCIRKPSLW
ncbi:hypothetical protein [Acanthopleuribacter pedis]|uniref:Uncharacterized protein n=1 Tax=Acanthopleuribacter pedis TaxID=442870 RepID=A0A8J7QB77_9BACT|nr:hypothetical protein [Acanthopleuribacter pedis]MBO1321252.1 hypothetical protein [Acanthopleuribacter pedis]